MRISVTCAGFFTSIVKKERVGGYFLRFAWLLASASATLRGCLKGTQPRERDIVSLSRSSILADPEHKAGILPA